jgi:hypothetical protein
MTDDRDMTGDAGPTDRIVPFCRRWHVIGALDLARLLAGHAELRTLCDRLEAYADALPTMPSPAENDAVRARLAQSIERYAQGGGALLDALFRGNPQQPMTAALLAHIRARRAVDDANAQDLIAALDPAPEEQGRFPPEMLGYMLRGVFDGCRRAMDFTELAILTLGDRRLTGEARGLLIASLARNVPA